MTISVAIDGPSGAGKSTVARRAAQELGYIYVDTGALYRAIALYLLRANIKADDVAGVENALKNIEIGLEFSDEGQQVILNGENVSDLIRTPEVSMLASTSSALPVVRAFLLEKQRGLAKTQNIIMDGRDIGTVVLPDAQVKIFLTASVEERATRRFEELTAKGQDVSYEDIYKDIEKRDYQDSHREIAPLKPAADSILLDNTGFAIEQSAAEVRRIIGEKLARL